jgi:hypothetical protein
MTSTGSFALSLRREQTLYVVYVESDDGAEWVAPDVYDDGVSAIPGGGASCARDTPAYRMRRGPALYQRRVEGFGLLMMRTDRLFGAHTVSLGAATIDPPLHRDLYFGKCRARLLT